MFAPALGGIEVLDRGGITLGREVLGEFLDAREKQGVASIEEDGSDGGLLHACLNPQISQITQISSRKK